MSFFWSTTKLSDLAQPSTWTITPVVTACNCVGGEDCCIKRGQRDRDEALREEGRQQERARAKATIAPLPPPNRSLIGYK